MNEKIMMRIDADEIFLMSNALFKKERFREINFGIFYINIKTRHQSNDIYIPQMVLCLYYNEATKIIYMNRVKGQRNKKKRDD